MATLTLTDARNLMLKGKPWTFRMEFQGPNPNNVSGWSTKFWLATGRARHEPVEIHYGTIGGGTPTILVKDWDYIEQKAPEKEAKGYVYKDTPFVRVRQSTINVWLTSQGQPKGAPLPVQPSPPPAPPKPPVATSGLPGPWGRVSSVQKQADGSWWGLDSVGGKVLQMTKDGARNLVQSYPHITVAGL